MHNKWSLNLGKAAGIKVLIHFTFFILSGWLLMEKVHIG